MIYTLELDEKGLAFLLARPRFPPALERRGRYFPRPRSERHEAGALPAECYYVDLIRCRRELEATW